MKGQVGATTEVKVVDNSMVAYTLDDGTSVNGYMHSVESIQFTPFMS